MMTYAHQSIQGQPIDLPVGKVVCVGRNYLAHIDELGNQVPEQPLLFIKPNTALTPLEQPVVIPKNLGACHNEVEIAVLIQHPLKQASEEQIKDAIWGLGLGLDLTLREVQDKAKAQGHPWERAKAFDASCPMSGFIQLHKLDNLTNLSFSLRVNDNLRQQGNTQNMLVSIQALLKEISQSFTLLPGDIVMTGTPKGVAALLPGDQLSLSLDSHFCVTTVVE
ncbi:fumarylacetoacetate hydrolase family protein [Paraglaciecola aestuariivivens]